MTLGLVDGADLLAAFTVASAGWEGLIALAIGTVDARKDGASTWFGLPERRQALMLRTVRLAGQCMFEIRGEPGSGLHLLAAGGHHVWELRAAPATALGDATPVPADAVALDDGGRIVVSGARTKRTRPIRPDRAASLGASLRLLLDRDLLDGAAGPVGNFDALEAWLLPDGLVAVHLTLGEYRFESAVPREAVDTLAAGLSAWARKG